MSEREDGKQVIREVHFRKANGNAPAGPPPGYSETPDAPGVHTTERYRNWLREQITGVIAEQPDEQLDPEVKALADELAIVHLPQWKQGERVIAEPSRVEIRQAQRLAEYLVKGRGVRVHPEHETLRWVATPNGGPHDLGIHIEKDEHGEWPTPDPEAFFDLEKIVVTQGPDGSWVAAHPCGANAQGASKAKAHADVVQQLIARIEEARSE